MGGEYGPLGRRHSGKGRVVPVRCPSIVRSSSRSVLRFSRPRTGWRPVRSSRLSFTLQAINDSPPIQRGRGSGLSVWEDVQQVALIVGYAAESSPSRASLTGLDGSNFFNAAMLAGFGPYVAVYLAEQKWTQENIGFVLTASGLAGLLALMPGGELLD